MNTQILTELSPEELNRQCDPEALPFEDTDGLPDLEEVIGQPRALRALELGSGVPGHGFNTFILGQPGSGRTTLSREYLERKAVNQSVPSDWAYVNNFEDPRYPIVLELPSGDAPKLRSDIKDVIERCQVEIDRIFKSDEYKNEHDRLLTELKKDQEDEFTKLQEHVESNNFMIARTSFGFVLVPGVHGKPLKPEEIEKLSAEQQKKLKDLQEKLGAKVERTLTRIREREDRTNQLLRDLNESTVAYVLEPILKPLFKKYKKHPLVLAHLESLQLDIIDNQEKFQTESSPSPVLPGFSPSPEKWLHRYDVNVLVDNGDLRGAPVVVENHPSYGNLLGRIEHEVAMGASRTDFTMIHPGALHRANGGFLIIPARDLLINPYAWEGIKRVLREGKIRIVELANQLGVVSTVTLEPEPIPLHIKIVLIGTPLLYYMLRSLDEDFTKLFKVRADFTDKMVRSPETELEYGLFVKSVVEGNKLPPFDRTAVARIIEYSSRLADDQTKLTTRFGKIADIVREAAFWAAYEPEDEQKNQQPVGDRLVKSADVQQAIDESIYRSDLIVERLQEMIRDGTLMIDVTGKQAGQINALSVMLLADFAFGKPSRVTASAYVGRGGIIDIERQANLGGPVHTKGILILNGVLGQLYGQMRSISLSANITFEQSYDSVEGDSASAAELLALLSAVANIPLRQDRAITGSINQQGQIQAIGSVNEKIEGFFLTCKTLGLTGEQGVVIPKSNSKQLMLNQDVVEAVRNGEFHIWSISIFDEAITLFSDMDPGVVQDDGSYSADSFHQRVVERLEEFAELEEKKKNEQADPPKGAEQESDDQEKKDETGEDKGTTASHPSAS